MRVSEPLLVLLLLPALLLPGCTRQWWADDADREVEAALAGKQADFDTFRKEGVLDPRDLGGAEEREEEDLSDVPRQVGLEEALAIATARNRDYVAERESLYLSALALTGARSDFSFVFSGAVSAVLSDTSSTSASNRNEANVGVSRILPTGGKISADVSASANATSGTPGGHQFSSDWSVDLTQPLLRDAGYETSHEVLTQAERNVVYAIRDFELFREDFTIDIVSQFYSIVRQMREIENQEKDLEAREFLKRQSEAKWQVDMATEVDKLRADREYLRAKNDLLDLRESLQLALDRFKIRLGLPTTFPLEIRPEEPLYREVEIGLRECVTAALHNRLDLISTRDRLEDAERQLRITANRLLPDLDLSAGFARSAPETGSPSDLSYRDARWTIGLALTLPLERTAERNALRRAMIDVDRARRSLSLAEDNVILEVRDALRQLRRAETSLEIRREEIVAAKKEEKAARFRFEEGELSNRDLTDAQSAVLRAQNAYIRTLVEFEEARIRLLRHVGILFIDEKGMWVEP